MADAAEYAAISAEMMGYVRLLELPHGIEISPATLLGAMGVPGLSAYVSFFEYVKEPRAGKTLWVSAASGAVGQLVGQFAKMHGMKVIGSTGSQEKVDFVTRDLGFDAAWNYKTEKTADALDRLAPEGIDFYYDNVGGEQLEVALTRMKDFGHIISSGMMSVYMFPDEEKYGIRTGMNIFLKRLTITGFICSDPQNMAKYMGTFPSVSICLPFSLRRFSDNRSSVPSIACFLTLERRRTWLHGWSKARLRPKKKRWLGSITCRRRW